MILALTVALFGCSCSLFLCRLDITTSWHALLVIYDIAAVGSRIIAVEGQWLSILSIYVDDTRYQQVESWWMARRHLSC